jgi:para-aminobenzoate synthetase/4-amino-4-deoxychorismate lyase
MRFLDSAAYFNFLADWRAISAHLAMIAAKYPDGLYKVRLLLDRRGKFSIEAQKTSAITGPVNCALAAEQIDSGNTFLYHKTTYRQIYKNAEELIPSDAFSVLLWNEKKELTEFLIGNLVMEKDGKFFTPPVSCGLLPGTLRQQLLETGKIQEKIILKDKLVDYDAIWFINSIRGWLQVEMI